MLVLSVVVFVLEFILELLSASEFPASPELLGGGVLILVLRGTEQFSITRGCGVCSGGGGKIMVCCACGWIVMGDGVGI